MSVRKERRERFLDVLAGGDVQKIAGFNTAQPVLLDKRVRRILKAILEQRPARVG